MIAALLAALLSQAPNNPSDLFARAVDQRRAITSAVIECKINNQKIGQKERNYQRTVYFGGNKVRGDTKEAYDYEHPNIVNSHFTEVSCFGCYDDDNHVTYSDKISPEGAPSYLNLRKRDVLNSGKYFVPSPHMLGMTPTTLLNSKPYHLESFLRLNSPLKDSKITESQIDDVSCWKVSYTRDSGAKFSVWIAPELDYSVLQMHMEFTSPKSKIVYVDLIKSKISKDQLSGVYFPEHLEYSRTENGVVTKQESVEIQVISLNEDIDPRYFTLKGIETLKDNTHVHWLLETPPPGGAAHTSSLVWRNGKIQPDIVPRRRVQIQSNAGFNRLYYLIAGNILIIIAGGILYKLLSRKRL